MSNEPTMAGQLVPANAKTTALAEAESRAMQEVQAMYFMAWKKPRVYSEFMSEIHEKCKNPRLADEAQYSFPRGNSTVTGPSIRLAEAIAQSFGNLDFGWKQTGHIENGAIISIWCRDLEKNAGARREIEIVFERQLKGGAIQRLSDPRDRSEFMANMAARHLRSCIQAVIPRDIFDEACDICDATIKAKSKGTLAERIVKMVEAFKDVGVTEDMIKARLQKLPENMNETDFMGLRKIYQTLKDGMEKPEMFFYQEAKNEDAPPVVGVNKNKHAAVATVSPEPTPDPVSSLPETTDAHAKKAQNSLFGQSDRSQNNI